MCVCFACACVCVCLYSACARLCNDVLSRQGVSVVSRQCRGRKHDKGQIGISSHSIHALSHKEDFITKSFVIDTDQRVKTTTTTNQKSGVNRVSAERPLQLRKGYKYRL